MKKKYTITDWVFTALLGALCLAALLIWPAGALPVKQLFSTLEAGTAQSGEITEAAPLAGIFQPVSPRLHSIGIKFYIPERSDNPGYLVFQLSDGQGNALYSETVYFSDMQNNQYYEFQIKQRLDPGQAYLYQVNAYGYVNHPPKAYLASPQTAAPGQAAAYYAGAELVNTTPVVRFTYYGKAGFRESLPYLICLCGAALLLLSAWKQPYINNNKETEGKEA